MQAGSSERPCGHLRQLHQKLSNTLTVLQGTKAWRKINAILQSIVKSSSVARGVGGGYSPLHWPVNQNAE